MTEHPAPHDAQTPAKPEATHDKAAPPDGIVRALSLAGHSLVFVFFAALVAGKVYVLVLFGPQLGGDTIGYQAFADQIRSGGMWTSIPDLDRQWYPVSAFRMIGYPLLIVGAQAVAGDSWAWVLAGLQTAISIVATWFLYRAARDLSGLLLVGLLAAGIYAVSQALLFDLFVLTDSLHNALIIIVVSQLARMHLLGLPATPRGMLGLGILLACAFLLRDFQLYLLVLYLPLLLAYVLTAAHRAVSRAILIVAFVGPVLLTATSYLSWNATRSGEAFIATGTQTAAVWALAKVDEDGTAVFAGKATVLDVVAEETLDTYAFSEIIEINRRLFAEYGLNGIQIAKLASASFFDAFQTYPNAFLLRAASNMMDSAWMFRPGFIPLLDFSQKRDTCFGTEPPVDLEARFCRLQIETNVWSRYAYLLLFGLVPAHLILAAVLGQPVSRRLQVATGLWVIGTGYVVLYSLINMEIRYVLPAAAVFLLIAALYIGWIIDGGRWVASNGRAAAASVLRHAYQRVGVLADLRPLFSEEISPQKRGRRPR